MKDPQKIIHKFLSSKFLVAHRSNGLVCPGAMRLVDFQTALTHLLPSLRPTGIGPRSGLYLLESDGSFVNVHREIQSLLKAGLLEFSRAKNGRSWILHVKRSNEEKETR